MARPQYLSSPEARKLTKHIYGIYGASGYGKECLPLLRYQIAKEYEVVFIDDGLSGATVKSVPVLSYKQFLQQDGIKYCVIAIANSTVREKLSQLLAKDHIKPMALQAHNATLYDDSDIGEGYILNPYACITADVHIGKYLHANVHTYIAHDCVLGDFVTLAPGAIVCGNVRIGSHAYIGANAVIKQGTPNKPLAIGPGAVIGMGAVVTKDVPAGAVVVGNPARPLIKS